MMKSIEKIIAREFLYLMLLIFSGVFTFGIISLNNLYYEVKISNLQKEIAPLRNPYFNKIQRQFWLTNKLCESVIDDNGDRLAARKKIWNSLFKYSLEDKLKFKLGINESKEVQIWDNEIILALKEIGFSNAEKFKKFIDESRISQIEINNYNKSLKLLNQSKILNSNLFDKEKQIKITQNVVITSWFIFFVLRIMFLGIKWAIKTLRD